MPERTRFEEGVQSSTTYMGAKVVQVGHYFLRGSRVQSSKFGFAPALIRIVSTYWNGTMKCLTMKKYDTLITY